MFNGPPPERLGDASSRSARAFCAGLSSSYFSGRKRSPRRLSSGAAAEIAAAPISAPRAPARMSFPRMAILPFKRQDKLHRLVHCVRCAGRHRILVGDEQHGETGEMAHGGDGLDDAALAEFFGHSLEIGVADLPRLQ